jgi:hypothetical protein
MNLRALALGMLSSVILFSCKKSLNSTDAPLSTDNLVSAEANPARRSCASYEVLQQQLQDDPSYQKRLDEIEAFTANYIRQQSKLSGTNILSGSTLIVPVVVNVVYRSSSENISRDQIVSQIDVLNNDFAGTNKDYNASNVYNGIKAGATQITFKLDTIFRKSSNKLSWSTNNAVKKTSQGGLNPTNPTRKLNIWVCNLSNGILGYAQFPGGDTTTDGVVIHFKAFGTKGTLFTTYNLGRTATHEVGHWFNLRHIWGDATCGNDNVDDTPVHNKANYGCPSTLAACSGNQVQMTWNYMDYTDDACMYMFTAGQSSRMTATFASNGPRASLR